MTSVVLHWLSCKPDQIKGKEDFLGLKIMNELSGNLRGFSKKLIDEFRIYSTEKIIELIEVEAYC